jgi:hypothetical protein
VSGGIYCLDVDDFAFAVWLESYSPLKESGAWVVRTGSGKMHIWLRSREKVVTTVMIGGGNKLADVRGDGHENAGPSYVVAPPTLHPISSKPYETLYGSPEFIREVSDARATFDGLRDRYLGGVVDAPQPHVERQEESGGRNFIVTLDAEAAQRVRERIEGETTLSRRVKRALLRGAEAGDSQWFKVFSNSEVDHEVIRELVRAGWDLPSVEEAFAFSPLGDHRYRDKHKTYGHSYLMHSFIAHTKAEAEAVSAAAQASGTNFRIDRVVRVGFEAPLYEVYVMQTAPFERESRATLDVEDLMDEHRFKRAIMRHCNFLPDIAVSLLGRKFEKFGALLLAMAEEETVPERATTGGHLKATIRAFIEDEANVEEPEDHRMITLGWRHNGSVFVRGGALLQRLQAVIYPRPKPEEAWTILRALGGQEAGHTWPATGKRETVWMLPARRVQSE